MELAAIAPLALMERWPELAERPTHMCLAQLALQNSKYLEWMRARSREGKTVILDNGAYEQQTVGILELTGLAAYMRPRFVVVPDEPNDPESSCALLRRFMDFPGSSWLRNFGVSPMVLIHGWPGAWNSFCETWRTAAYYDAAVGLSRLTQDFGVGLGGDRLLALRLLLELHWHPKYIHLFGFGGNAELAQLKTCALPIDSIDTSAPIWRGLNGYKLTDPWPDYPFELEGCFEWSSGNELVARQNLEEFDGFLPTGR